MQYSVIILILLTIMSSFSTTSSLIQNARIALCQVMVHGTDKVVNIRKASDTITKAVIECRDKKLDIAVLPEVWNSPYATTSFPIYAEPIPNIGQSSKLDISVSPSTVMLCQQAKLHSLWLVGGSIPEIDNGKLYNTALVINPDGEIIGKHRKVHLFDIDVPGKVTFKESDSLTAGNEVTVVDTPWGGMGIGICYDIRFPEYGMLMRKRGARMLIYPGAFNMVTGPAHWELLQRARAVDNQCYVAACSPARNESSSYIAWGHSSVISPWGEVISKAGHDDEIIYADLDFNNVETMRQNIPCWKQKRNDLYELQTK